MINCKKDLINTYVKNTPELRREFLSFAVKFGLIDSKSKIGESSEDAVVAYWNDVTGDNPKVGCWFAYADQIKEECRELTLSDLKPRTKTEFVKCEFDSAWEAIKSYEVNDDLYYCASSTPTYEKMKAENMKNLLDYSMPIRLYRKVETEINERQEFIDRVLEMLDFNEAYDGNKIVSDMYDNFGFRFKLMETDK
ncbi:hypothetical protein NVP1106O_74 [Vibrio phage 1.106.O._10N.286.51.F7]|nr:hypothetical protein NVP1106O_74 [Vibrio phage 1.106.O._10N.286.51.F7]